MRLSGILLLVPLLLLAVPARSQSHSVSLSWNASADAAANPTLAYNVYRLSGACPATGTAGFTKLSASPVSGTTFTDATVPLAHVCYYLPPPLNPPETIPSNTPSLPLLP